jgi:hypothetical protein
MDHTVTVLSPLERPAGVILDKACAASSSLLSLSKWAHVVAQKLSCELLQALLCIALCAL